MVNITSKGIAPGMYDSVMMLLEYIFLKEVILQEFHVRDVGEAEDGD